MGAGVIHEKADAPPTGFADLGSVADELRDSELTAPPSFPSLKLEMLPLMLRFSQRTVWVLLVIDVFSVALVAPEAAAAAALFRRCSPLLRDDVCGGGS